MDLFGFPFPLLFIMAIVVYILIATSASNRRRQISWPHERSCHTCHTSNPLHANFCRRCGHRLG